MKAVISVGDINGISPEVGIKGLEKLFGTTEDNFIFVTPKNIFEEEYTKQKCKFSYTVVNELHRLNKIGSDKFVTLVDMGNAEQELGKPTKISGEIAFKSFRQAFEITASGIADFLITLPLAKNAMSLAGIKASGHTELLAEWCGSRDNFVMMFLGEGFKAALTTIHIPLKQTSELLSGELLTKKIKLILDSLRSDFGIGEPKAGVLGLNPHAGEGGLIGDEEKNIIIPVLNKFKKNTEGPFPADAYFGMKLHNKFDITIGMYHDQVLIPFKLTCFDSGVNYTAGLPVVRTSPDHGTAFDIAGKGIAKADSFLSAYYYAKQIRLNRNIAEKNKMVIN
ncbi:MAG TPA: 4-hydroxythreonine-4-phosphate dehydrogenase PdxA [Ignavibacteriaceae bacterium]|nr:4-hydroxythreonine-4-phosphate dehydrogenase PdxA [Ignavibacteriaceae bacterium]HPO56200.1 4-hydroxythreonine-4-phosphate dehydrogenase PdxA [Ignavibacteriaceae bacterium]